MFDPYFGIPGIQAEKSLYKDVPLLNYTNLFCFVTLNGAYVFLVVSVMYKTRQGNQAFLSKLQKQITIQALLICVTITFCSSIYVMFEFVPTFLPAIFLTIDFLLWQWGCCGAIIIYMVMNRTIRQGVIAFYLTLLGYSAPSQNIYSTDNVSQRPRSCAIQPTI
uniref:7TM_GPCR_Srx domain-containing protein n=1 Tax=Steinernema glaseri TaxID=37863 RepID=A0A1I7ZW31_9BILA